MHRTMKRFFQLLFVFGRTLLVTACADKPGSAIVAIQNEAEYEAVVAKDVSYLYFGFGDCPYCKKFRPLLEEELAATGQTAYYYNTKKRSDDANYDAVLETYGVAVVPLLLRLDEGKVTESVDFDTADQLHELLTAE